jgi:pantothenate kinase-related protein Tda10
MVGVLLIKYIVLSLYEYILLKTFQSSRVITCKVTLLTALMDTQIKNTKLPLIIGIAGGSASGKTTISEQIVKRLGGDVVTMLSMDCFYKRIAL